MPFSSEDRGHLTTAEGFIELGLVSDAWEELDEIQPRLQAHPDVLKLRTKILMNAEQWEPALELANARCRDRPNELDGFIDAAYCLLKFKRTAEAKERLMAGPPDKWDSALWHYNMACCECGLGDLATAKFYLQMACGKNPSFRQTALEDPDLKPLRDSMQMKWTGEASF